MSISIRVWVIIYYLIAGNTSFAMQTSSAYFFLQKDETQIPDTQVNNAKSDLPPENSKIASTTFECHAISNVNNSKVILSKKIIDGNLPITIRTAIIASPDYSNYFIEKYNAERLTTKEKKSLVKAELQKSIDEVNKVTLRDLNVRLELINDIDKLIYVAPNIYFEHINNHFDALTVAEEIIPKTISKEAYDLGHIFTTKIGGASGKNTAFTDKKWQGSTGAPIPEGARFNIDFFAHEIGHQLGASHTQNADCARNSNSSVEIDSGISIMSYAGICSLFNSNVSNHSAPFYHVFSIEQINSYLDIYFDRTNKNEQLVINDIPDHYIPIDTPFEIILETTPKSDRVLFNCEQVDTDVRNQKNTQNSVFGPSFISPELSLENTICFPPVLDVLNNNLHGEFNRLSESSRTYNFTASTRKMEKTTRMFNTKKFKVYTSGNEPLKITSQRGVNIDWKTNENQLITWNADAISKSPFNCMEVDISLALDGLHFDYEIAKNVTNNGAFKFLVPASLQSEHCRIKIKAANSIFYAINDVPFSINTTLSTEFYSSENGSITNSKLKVDEDFENKHIEVSVKLKSGVYENLEIGLIDPSNNRYELFDLECETRLEQFEATFISNWFENSSKAFQYDLCPDNVTGMLPFLSEKEKTTTAGNWQLVVTNEEKDVTSKIEEWGIQFYGEGTKVVTSITKEIEPETIVYPNPSEGLLWLDNSKFSLFTTNGSVLNTLGETVSIFTLNFKEHQAIDLRQLESGIYFIQLSSPMLSEIKKVIIK